MALSNEWKQKLHPSLQGIGWFTNIIVPSAAILASVIIITIQSYLPKIIFSNYFIFLHIFNFTAIVICYVLQTNCRNKAKDPKFCGLLARINPHNEFNILSLILRYNALPPKEIATVDVNAREVLGALQKFPGIEYVTHTIHDFKWRRFSWLAVSNVTDMVEKLRPGDFLLYHDKSIIGLLIQFFTRNYWHHVGLYDGEGMVMEAVPLKTGRNALREWTSVSGMQIAVLRNEKFEKAWKEYRCEGKKLVGIGFNYLGIIKQFWEILTFQKGTGLINRVHFITYMVFISIDYVFSGLGYERMQSAILLIASLYMGDTIKHWIAYLYTKGDPFEKS